MTEATAPARIKIEDAQLPELKHFATLALGVEVKPGTNATQLRAMILKVMPDCKDVPPVPATPEPIVRVADTPPAPPAIPANYVPVEGEDPAKRPAAISLPASRELVHSSLDPKVRIVIQKTDDKKRPKDVTICVNGEVTRIQRGQEVDVPYRVFEALLNAKERAAVPGDEINPFTQEPIMVWEDVYSYPFSVIQYPPADEVAAWKAASGAGFKNAA
jgi:type IV secretory pathway VirB10-like protein